MVASSLGTRDRKWFRGSNKMDRTIGSFTGVVSWEDNMNIDGNADAVRRRLQAHRLYWTQFASGLHLRGDWCPEVDLHCDTTWSNRSNLQVVACRDGVCISQRLLFASQPAAQASPHLPLHPTSSSIQHQLGNHLSSLSPMRGIINPIETHVAPAKGWRLASIDATSRPMAAMPRGCSSP